MILNKNKIKIIRTFFLVISLTIITDLLTAQSKTKPPINDFSAILHEETMNKVFKAIDTIRGSNDYEVMFVKGKYHWSVYNLNMFINPDSSTFICDASVRVGPFNYNSKVPGIIKISYDQKKNEIQVKLTKAIFELYTEVFGKKIHIKNIDIADYLKDPFIFEGPKTMATDFEFTMPDSTKKHIYIQPTICEMVIRPKEICTRCEVEVSDKPFKSAVPIKPTTTTVPPPKSTDSTTNGKKK
jgi:hypothetical protein